MFKGTTKIELIDTRNGHTDTYEDSNMFTNGISQVLNYTGINDNKKFESNIDSETLTEKTNYSGVLSNSEYPTINSLTGGLLLLSDYVTENQDQLTIPKDNEIIGRACLENNESTQTGEKNGSLTESEFVDKHKYKYTWEFNETQANGTISCVCLTNPLGAVKSPVNSNSSEITYPNKFPYNKKDWECVNDGNGNASNTLLNRVYYNYGDQREELTQEQLDSLNSMTRPVTFFKDGIVLIDGYRDCLYTLYVNNINQDTSLDKNIISQLYAQKVLRLKKYRFPFRKFSLFDDRDVFNKKDDYSEIVTLNFPNVFNYSDVYNYKQTLAFSNDGTYFYVYSFEFSPNANYDQKNDSHAMNKRSNNNFIFQFNISDMSYVKYWNISYEEIGAYICSWRNNWVNNNSLYASINNDTIYNSDSICNACNDFCVSNDKLYFFGKYNDGEGNGKGLNKNIYLLSYDLNNGYLKKVKFNGNPVVIVEKDWNDNDNYRYNNYGVYGDRGVYDGYEFSISNPYVSMVNSSKGSLLITMLSSGKTFQINNDNHDEISEETLYLKYNDKINNPFWLDETYTLESQIQPTSFPSGYTISYLHYPLKENILYVGYGFGENNGYFIKIKSKFNKTFKDNENNELYTEQESIGNSTYGVQLFIHNGTGSESTYDFINDYGCYDIIKDPTVLVTINNLSTRIEKKSYQRMKVTYTITEVL